MRHTEHFLLLSWLLTTGLIAAGAWVIVDQGLLHYLVATDRSYISLVVIAMYIVGLAHSFGRTLYLSDELNKLARIERSLDPADPRPLRLEETGLTAADGTAMPRGFLSDFISDLLRARRAQPSGNGEAIESAADLLEAAAARIRGHHEFGWFLIDLMLKVGFLGTLIGFIWMLASVSEHAVIDAASMLKILREMSYGMSTALNTTLSSLVGGILLSLPYYMLARGLDELLEVTVRLTRVRILPRLEPASV
ncbi:MAG: MotA/TolQ/ExbB proton channel family protein [Gammaproteobacteria bacterium]|nr:MotA/TolQ/ExbB proton channel family protein [Gammaproteobacteria bacterium]